MLLKLESTQLKINVARKKIPVVPFFHFCGVITTEIYTRVEIADTHDFVAISFEEQTYDHLPFLISNQTSWQLKYWQTVLF